ncbi:hypothetical protein NDU88_008098, partial [Pleurodeles waltl]
VDGVYLRNIVTAGKSALVLMDLLSGRHANKTMSTTFGAAAWSSDFHAQS